MVAAEQLRIVEESFSGPRLASARRADMEFPTSGRLPGARRIAEGSLAIFRICAAMIVPEQPEKGSGLGGSRIEIVSANGRRVIVDCDVGVETRADHAWA